jgi:2-dehydrotetronate isomerase
MLAFAANLNFLFTELPFLDRFEAASKAGFKAVESTDPYQVSASEIAARLKANGLTLVLFNTPAGSSQAGERGLAALPGRETDFQAAVETALRLADVTGGRQVHVLAGLVHQGARRATYVANLKAAAKLAAKDDVTLLIEPINRRDIPGYFLNRTEDARSVIHEVGEPSLGLQFDIYHRQVEQGDVIAAMREFHPLIRHYQIASPPDRGEPDDGELNYRTLFREIDASGFNGFVGCEYRPRRETVEGLRWAEACGVRLG